MDYRDSGRSRELKASLWVHTVSKCWLAWSFVVTFVTIKGELSALGSFQPQGCIHCIHGDKGWAY